MSDTAYCFDTSALVDAWYEYYPPENFPRFWGALDALIGAGQLVAPVDVREECAKKTNDLHDWLKERPQMFVELDEAIQQRVADLLAKHPRLVAQHKTRTAADPWVISLAVHKGFTIVTQEKPTGNMNRPNIPDICDDADFKADCIRLVDLIKAEAWIIG